MSTATTAQTGAVDIVEGRARADVPGAAEVLVRFHELAAASAPGMAAARALVSTPVDWSRQRELVLTAPRGVVLAVDDSAALLAARFAPGASTTPHAHGLAGAALVVEGHSSYERFSRVTSTTAVVESRHELAPGDVAWWGVPPDDVHRQTGGPDGSIELVLACGREYRRVDLGDATVSSALATAVGDALLRADAGELRSWYAPDVLVDVNVPQWRYQSRGVDGIQALWDEEFEASNRRVTHLRLTETVRGLVAETEVRDQHDGEARLWREVHQFRLEGGRITEQVVWCSGIWDPATVSRQFRDADMERM